MEAGLSLAMKKAILITGGQLKIPKDLVLPFAPSRSTAGPGAGSTSIVIAFEGSRCKKAINREAGEFELVPKDGGYRILRNGQPFLEEVELRPTIAHAPEQAFFNLAQDCIYDCKFCASRKLDKRITKNLSPETGGPAGHGSIEEAGVRIGGVHQCGGRFSGEDGGAHAVRRARGAQVAPGRAHRGGAVPFPAERRRGPEGGRGRTRSS